MKQAKNLRYKRTLFVGLGGAGAKTLRLVKEQIMDANEGKLPGQVKFLLIDTNATDLANYRDFDSGEKVCIAVREPYQRYQHDKKIDAKTHEFIPKQNVHSLLALERGAGQIRSNGHFAVIENQYSNKLMQVFRHTSEELEDIDIKGETLERDPKIEVRVVFSLAGGTGSGTFLPISVLLRSAIKHCELTAYIYSATHYERIVERSAKYSVMQNAYASLCELDYMMHFGLNDSIQEPIQFKFGPKENQWITQSARPFEEVYYIDKITSLPTPDAMEFAYNEIDRMQKNTADALFLMSTNIISPHAGTVDNVRRKIMEGQFNVEDKFAWVSGFGMSELYLCQLNAEDAKIIEASKKALSARIDDCEDVDCDKKASLVSAFMKNRWDESGGESDGDPILKNFLMEFEIRRACEDILVKRKIDSESYSKVYDEKEATLDSILKNNSKSVANDIRDGLIKDFKENLEEFIKKILNEESYNEVKIEGNQVKENGISFKTLNILLKGIKGKLEDSKNKLEEESKKIASNETEGKKKVDAFKFENDQKRKKGIQLPAEYSEELAKKKSIPLAWRVLNDRHKKAIEVLAGYDQSGKEIDGCINITDKWIKLIEKWHTILKAAYDYGGKKTYVDTSKVTKEEKENKVEVSMLEVGKYKLLYEDIKSLYENRNQNSVYEGQSMFEDICGKISKDTGDLHDYLSQGLNANNNSELIKKSQFNKELRTPFQKSIDRMIDLSTPTMQIDGHGFGEEVKADQFWYIMTDCGEDKSAEDCEQRKKLKSNSVGGLLKQAIEKNTLDERVNLVHVSGWKNKALLYRVLSAVPPYFVEGVCISDRGGITLEGCYEELKKTRRTYTPFSHETLRKKLENRICVLKPNESMAEGEAMNHWLNFNLLGYIHFESQKGTTGQYSVWSKELGEVLTASLTDNNPILVLGKTRQEAFETFCRYSKVLVDEYSNEDNMSIPYVDLINPLDYDDEEDYYNKFIMDGKKYLDKIFRDYTFLWHGERISWEKLNRHLTQESLDFKILKKEMEAMDVRLRKYNKAQSERKKAEETSKGYDKQ